MNEKETSSAADRTLQMNAHELLIRLVKQKAKVIAVVLYMFCFSVVVHWLVGGTNASYLLETGREVPI